MSERTDPTIKQIADSINTERDIDAISRYIVKKFKETDSCGSRYVPTNEFFYEVGINPFKTSCTVILALIEDYFKNMETGKKELLDQFVNERQIINSIPNTPKHA